MFRYLEGFTAFAVGHIFPLSYGGLTAPQNLQALHWKENLVQKTDDTSLPGYGKLSSDQGFDEQIGLNSGDPMWEKLFKASSDHIIRSQWALQRLENVLCYEVSDLSTFRPGGLLDLEVLTPDHEALQSLSISTQPREANHEATSMLAVAKGRSYYKTILYKLYPNLASIHKGGCSSILQAHHYSLAGAANHRTINKKQTTAHAKSS